jgi:hypothetical protein
LRSWMQFIVGIEGNKLYNGILIDFSASVHDGGFFETEKHLGNGLEALRSKEFLHGHGNVVVLGDSINKNEKESDGIKPKEAHQSGDAFDDMGAIDTDIE